MSSSFLNREFWSKLLSNKSESERGEKRFSYDELRNLYDVLNRNPVVHEGNRALVVETIRSLAEFMIWGDQHEPKIFEFFLEHNVMAYLHRVLLQPANRAGDVAKQVLQTLGMIIQNVRSETGIFFLFSNNHINHIVEIQFDFEDEEVMGFYIAFLKAISLKLTPQTVQFFFVEGSVNEAPTFPLYAEAAKLAHHKEGMVRAGVRTLTLNVYTVPDPYIYAFVTSPPFSKYFYDCAAYFAEQVRLLDSQILSAESFGQLQLSSLDSQLAEVEDMIAYCADVLQAAHPYVAHMLSQQLWSVVFGPTLLSSLLMVSITLERDAAGKLGPIPEGAVRPRCALYVLERIFQVVTYKPLIHNMLVALLSNCSTGGGSLDGAEMEGGLQNMPTDPVKMTANPSVSAVSPHPLNLLPLSVLVNKDSHPDLYPNGRSALVAIIRGEDQHAVAGALRMLVAAGRSQGASPEVLHLLGLLLHSRLPELLGLGHSQGAVLASCPLCSLEVLLAKENEEWQAHKKAMMQGMRGPSRSALTRAGDSCYAYRMLWTDATRPVMPSFGAPPLQESEEATDEEGVDVGEGGAQMDDDESGSGSPMSPPEPPITMPPPPSPYTEDADEGSAEASDLMQSNVAASADVAGGTAPAAPVVGSTNAVAESAPQLEKEVAGEVRRVGVASVPTDPYELSTSEAAAVHSSSAGSTETSLPQDQHTQAAPASANEQKADDTSGGGGGGGGGADVNNVVEYGVGEGVGAHPLDGCGDGSFDAAAAGAAAGAGGAGTAEDGAAGAAAATAGAVSVAEAMGAGEDGAAASRAGVAGVAEDEAAADAAGVAEAVKDVAGASEDVAGVGCTEAGADADGSDHMHSAGAAATEDGSGSGAPVHSSGASGGEDMHSVMAAAAAVAAKAAGSFAPPVQPSPACEHHRLPLLESEQPPSSEQWALRDAMYMALLLQLLPVPSLWHAGFLLEQLSPEAKPTAVEAASHSTRGHSRSHSYVAHPVVPGSTAGGRGPREMDNEQASKLQLALAAAVASALDELGGMWCEAVFPLIVDEWPRAAEGLLRPRLQTSAETLILTPAMYPLPGGPAGSNQLNLSNSAIAALLCFHSVQRLVTLMQVHMMLVGGLRPSREAPLPVLPEMDKRHLDIMEGQQVNLKPASAIPCVVSFAPGQERRVYFSVAGQALSHAHDYLDGGPTIDDMHSQAEMLHSSPALVLADPAPTKLNAGIVLSVAPLLGCDPIVDKNVAKWLHVHVRPSVRGLLRVLRTALTRRGGVLIAMRQLADGHWVLAFPDAERAANALALVEQTTGQLRSTYGDVLETMFADVLGQNTYVALTMMGADADMASSQHTISRASSFRSVGTGRNSQHGHIQPPQDLL